MSLNPCTPRCQASTYTRSGLYGGFHGSFVQAHASGTTGVLDPTADTFGGRAGMIAASESADLDFSGGQFGLQAGFNRQFANRFVLGVEADWSKSWTRGHQDNFALDDQVAIDSGFRQSRTRHDIDWTASLRGRLGYAFDNGLMLYGTAGVAVLKEDVTRDQYMIQSQNYVTPTGTGDRVTWVDRDSATRVGAAAGFGGEYALNDRWSLKGEYIYSRFGAKDYEFANARAGASPGYTSREQIGTNPLGQPIYRYTQNEGGYGTVNGRTASNSLDQHVFRLGLNYRF